MVSIHNYSNSRYTRDFRVRKLNLLARITGKLLDGRSEQIRDNWQSKKLLGLLESPYFIQDIDNYEVIRV